MKRFMNIRFSFTVVIAVFFFIFIISLAGSTQKTEAAQFCIKGECGDFAGWVDNYLFFNGLDCCRSYWKEGSKKNYWPNGIFPPTPGEPVYCNSNISGGPYCRNDLANKKPSIRHFVFEPSTVRSGTVVTVRWEVDKAWYTELRGWCDWCIGHDRRDSPAFNDDWSDFPHRGSKQFTIPGDWRESPKYTIRLYASNSNGDTEQSIEIRPENNIINAATRVANDTIKAISDGVVAAIKKIADCAGQIGGEIAGKFKDIWGVLSQVGGYLAAAGTNLATAGTGGGAVQVACVAGITSAAAIVGSIIPGLGTAAIGSIGYVTGSLLCPLAENAGWTIVDVILCATNQRNAVVKSDNIRLVVGIAEALSKIDWNNVGNFLKCMFGGCAPPAGVPRLPDAPIPAAPTPAGTVIVGVGGADDAANALQVTTNTELAKIASKPTNIFDLSPLQQGALETSGRQYDKLIEAVNPITNVGAKALKDAGVTPDQVRSFVNGLNDFSKAVFENASEFCKVQMIIQRNVNAC
ncbi:hypothetical protein HYV71_00355 [Candidatus Uhrbacteria bacterium]|nr:hypothetical protein [Candidatus Uhrbacteria bacterium]